MFDALGRTLAQLTDRRFLQVLLASTLVTGLLFVGLWLGLDTLLGRIEVTHWPSWLAAGWTYIEAGGALVVTLLALLLLFPAVATGVMSLFLDAIVDAVEDRHYPGRRATRSIGVLHGAGLGLASALRLLGWNLLAVPLYIVLLFTAVGPVVLYLSLNGYLLGRDLLQMVAIRHMAGRDERNFARRHRALAMQAGLVTSLAFMVPVANLLAPLVGAALATHLFHKALPHAAH